MPPKKIMDTISENSTVTKETKTRSKSCKPKLVNGDSDSNNITEHKPKTIRKKTTITENSSSASNDPVDNIVPKPKASRKKTNIVENSEYTNTPVVNKSKSKATSKATSKSNTVEIINKTDEEDNDINEEYYNNLLEDKKNQWNALREEFYQFNIKKIELETKQQKLITELTDLMSKYTSEKSNKLPKTSIDINSMVNELEDSSDSETFEPNQFNTGELNVEDSDADSE